MRIGIVLFVGVLASVSTARADAIVMPPPCPVGSTDAFCHGPPTCRPLTCTSSSSCSPGQVCMPLALCTGTNVCGGLGPSTSITTVYGACDASGGCAMGTCSTMSVCVTGSPADGGSTIDGGPSGPQHAAYCACRAGTHGGSALAIVGLLAVVGVLARRRA